MNIILRHGGAVTAAIALIGLIGLNACAASAPATRAMSGLAHVGGTVVGADGQPAPDATVTVYETTFGAKPSMSESTTAVSPTGQFEVTMSWDYAKEVFPIAVFSSPQGVGLLSFMRQDRSGLQVTLAPETSVRLHVVDDLGNPAVNVRVCPRYLRSPVRGFASWSEAITDRWSATTDAGGWAILTGLPQGWVMAVGVADDRYAEPDFNSLVALSKIPTSPDAVVGVARAGSIEGTVVFGDTKQPASDVEVSATRTSGSVMQVIGTTGPDGKYRITRVAPGSYNVWLMGGHDPNQVSLDDYTAVQQPASVAAGVAASGIDLTLIHGGIVAGTVTEIKTGKPIAGVAVQMNGPEGVTIAETDASGRYSLHVPPGQQSLQINPQPGMAPANAATVTVVDGLTATANFSTTAPLRTMVVQGTALDPDGKPVAGAKIVAIGAGPMESGVTATADDQGRFTLGESGPQVTSDMRIFAGYGAFGTPAGIPVSADAPIVVHLERMQRVAFRGLICDPAGKPIAGADVTLNRIDSANGAYSYADDSETDSTGHYELSPLAGGSQFSLSVRAGGYASANAGPFDATTGNPVDIPLVTIEPTDSFAGGTVEDVSGAPIAGAVVSENDVPGGAPATTDAAGRFRLDNAPRGSTAVFVQAQGFDLKSADIRSGHDDNVITVESPDRVLGSVQTAERLYVSDPTNHGDGEDADVLLRNACASAQPGGKNVLLDFHASWCAPCYSLHRFLADPAVRAVIDNYFVVREIDVYEDTPHALWESAGGIDLYKRCADHYVGLPLVAIVSPLQRVVSVSVTNGATIGYPTQPAAVDRFLAMLKSGAPDMTSADLATLRSGLARDAGY